MRLSSRPFLARLLGERTPRREPLPTRADARLPRFEPLEDRLLLATFLVNSTADVLYPPSGYTTLRSAVVEANARFGDDTVLVPAGNYYFSIAGTDEDSAAKGDLDIRGNLTIIGAGADRTMINASGLDRVFHVFAGISLDLRAVTVTGGAANAIGWGWFGGGIYTEGRVTITNTTVTGNSAHHGGGGIFGRTEGSSVTISNSTISNNSAGRYGGGIASGVQGSTQPAHNGTVTITDSVVSNNSGAFGGGVSFYRSNAAITSSTISGNVGPGICGDATLKNTIVAGNNGSGHDVWGSFTSQGHNLIGDVGSANGLTDGQNGDQVGGGGRPVIDPRLGPLQDNGGPTLTHALLPGSPAIDAGDNAGAQATDQRGFPRIVDGDGDGNARIDIGAFEAQQVPPGPPQLRPVADQRLEAGSVLTFTCTASDPNPGEMLTFSLDAGAPGGARIGPRSGVFAWTPTLADVGSHPVTVRVTDDGSPPRSDAETFTITVARPSGLPKADAGDDRKVIDGDGDWVETVRLDGSGSIALGATVSYVWTEDGAQIATGVSPRVDLAVGGHTIELTIIDSEGATDTDEVTVFVAPELGSQPLALITPVVASEVAAGENYQIRWYGGDAVTSVKMCCFGPTGLSVLAENLPGNDGCLDWDTAGAVPGRHCFVAQVEREGEWTYSTSPSWLRVTEPSGQTAAMQKSAPPVSPAGAAAAAETAVLAWRSPATGEVVHSSDAFELRWEAKIPSAEGLTASLWVSSAATEQWELIADDVAVSSGYYIWNTTGVLPGLYRFGIRLHEGGPGADLIRSGRLEVLPAGLPVLDP